MASAATIEETNRIRVSLGMAPLPVPGEEAAVSEDAENWNAHQEEQKRKTERQARNESIRKARDKAKRFEKLEGKGLADDDEEVDTKSWLRGQKKRQKKVEKERDRSQRKEEEQRLKEERQYTSKDLAGVKVGHELGEFDLEGGEQVLTLKDATIDEYEEEGDELENAQLREQERLKERLDLKKKKPVYDPNAMDEEGGFLQQYDEVIDGKKRKKFMIDTEGAAMEDRQAKRPTLDSAAKLQAISLDILKDVPTSDYQEPKEATFKKPKKTKKKSKRQKDFEDDDQQPSQPANGANTATEAMNIDIPDRPSVPKIQDSLIDDDDLQSSLAKQRKEALKKRKKITAQELAQKLREEQSDSVKDEDAEEPGLVLNETSEFLEALRPADIEEERRKAAARATESASAVKSTSDDEDEDVKMENGADDTTNLPVKSEADESAENKLTETGLDSDAKLDRGIGSTLNMLRQRRIVEEADTESLVVEQRNRQRFMADKRRQEDINDQKARMQRERDRASGKLNKLSQREREEYARWENKSRDQQDSRVMSEIFSKEYQPSFTLNYPDEHGRHMNQKEAFKQLSHQFHGKGSGKQKTEKHLKKIEEEKQQAAKPLD